MKIYLYRASNLESTITFLAFVSKRKSISGARQKHRFLQFFHNNSYHNSAVLHTGLSEDTETNSTSLIPLDTIFPEICAFKIGFSCTIWTKMRSFRAH